MRGSTADLYLCFFFIYSKIRFSFDAFHFTLPHFVQSKEDKPPSPVAVENLKAEISFSSHMTPSRRSPVTQQKTKVPVSALSDPPLEQPVYASSRESPISQAKTEVSEGLKSEPPSAQTLQTERDMVAPIGDTVVEERQTITMKPSPVVQDGRSLKDHVVLICGSYSPTCNFKANRQDHKNKSSHRLPLLVCTRNSKKVFKNVKYI